MVTTGIWENHFGSWKTHETDAYLCSVPKLFQAHSVHQILYCKLWFIPQLKLWLGCLIFPSLKLADLCSLSIQRFGSMCFSSCTWWVLLFHNGMCMQCDCAPCLCTSSTGNEMQSFHFSSEYFSYLCFPGSAMYLYYLLPSPRAPLQSTDKNWFSSCE